MQDYLEGEFIPSTPFYQFMIEVVFLLEVLLHSCFPIHTLFDSGASHSFISSDLVESLHLSTSLVDDPVCVSNPIGGSAYLSVV